MEPRENMAGSRILRAAISIHVALGPGLLESVYEIVLARVLTGDGLHVERQARVPISCLGLEFEEGFRADLIVERLVVVELKSVEAVKAVHKKQLLTYLRLGQYRLGYLLNFGLASMREGITRCGNGLPD